MFLSGALQRGYGTVKAHFCQGGVTNFVTERMIAVIIGFFGGYG